MLAKLVKTKRNRVEVAVSLFNCVTDIENFALKLWECVRAVANLFATPLMRNDCRHFSDVDERQDVVSRLGWMLVFNPLEVCGLGRFAFALAATNHARCSWTVFIDLNYTAAMSAKLSKCWLI